MNLKIVFLIAWLFPGWLQAWTHMGSNTYGWRAKKLTFYVNPTNCTLPENQLYGVIDKAMSSWNGLNNTDLEIVRADSVATDGHAQFRAKTATQVPLILCSNNVSDYGNLDADTVLGFVPYFDEDSEGYVNFSGLVLNAQPGALAELSQRTEGEIELVIGHEIGHVLGLGHTKDEEALMYFKLNKDFLLVTQDDQDGISHLYPRNLLGSTLGCGAVHQSHTNFPEKEALITLCFLVVLFFAGRLWIKTEPLL